MKKLFVFIFISFFILSATAYGIIRKGAGAVGYNSAFDSTAITNQAALKPVIEPAAWEIFNRFPLVLMKEQEAEFGLTAMNLVKDQQAFNCVDIGNRLWKQEILPAGTEVLAWNGIPVYKKDCRNKLFVPVAWKTFIAHHPKMIHHIHKIHKLSWWATDMGKFLKTLFWVLVALSGLLVFLLLLWGVVGIGRRLVRALRRRLSHGPTPPPPPVPPEQQIPPPAQPPASETATINATFVHGAIRVEATGVRSIAAEDLNGVISIRATRG